MTIMQMLMASSAASVALEFIGADANGNNDADFTLTYPAGIASGDLMVIVTSSKESTRSHPVAPAGWAEAPGGNTGFAIYTKTAAGSESGTLTMTSVNQQGGGVLFVLRGASSTLVDHDRSWLDTTDAVVPASVASAAGQIHLIGAIGNNIIGLEHVTPGGYTLADGPAGANSGNAVAYHRELAASGSTSTKLIGGDWQQKFCTWSVVIGVA